MVRPIDDAPVVDWGRRPEATKAYWDLRLETCSSCLQLVAPQSRSAHNLAVIQEMDAFPKQLEFVVALLAAPYL